MACSEVAAKHAEKVVDASVDRWDSYVSELGRAGGEFIGRGAKALGLTGRSEDGATWSLMNGIHPVSKEQFHRPYWTRVDRAKARAKAKAEGKQHREPVPSYAAIFAAPKSVSLLTMTSFREAALEAHRAAFAEAVRFIESRWFVRDRSGLHASLGVIATSHEHHTARTEVPEPHLHTHVTFMNFAQRALDGKWLAIDYKHFIQIQKAAGIVYQAALRRELAMRIPGIEFVLADNGTADIAQIPAKVREAFSTRQGEVMKRERELAATGMLPGNRRKDLAGYETRSQKKLVLNPVEWIEQQREALADLGVTDESIAAWADQERTITPPSWEVRREELADRLFGPKGLTEKSNKFTRWDVMEQVGIAHYADMESFEQLVARTDELLADPRVLAIGEDGLYTVRELVELEETVLEAHREVLPRPAARSGKRAAVRTQIEAAEASQGWKFNEGQRALIEGISSSKRQVDVVEALAGTGKTASMGMLAEILEKRGVRVIGAAPTGRARLELIQSAGLREVYTLAKLKGELERGKLILDPSRPIVLLVDEAGFAATRELAPVLRAVTAAGGHVVLVGDSGQLASVGAGGLFGAISRERQAHGMKLYKLDQVERHRTADGKIDYAEVNALAALHDGEPGDWFSLREKRGQMHIHTGADAGIFGIEHAAILYLDALKRRRPEDLYLLSPDNNVRAAVNERVREHLVEQGVIQEAGEIGGRKFAQGERIALRNNHHSKALANGMRATVLKVDPENGTLTVLIDGKHGGIHTLDREYVTGKNEDGLEFVQGGYANTNHTSQGGNAQETIVAGPAQALNKELGYVGGSRGRLSTHVVAWDGSPPEYFADYELTAQEQRQQVKDQLLDALARPGSELSVTEQIAHARDQLHIDLYDDTSKEEIEQPTASVEPVATTSETSSAENSTEPVAAPDLAAQPNPVAETETQEARTATRDETPRRDDELATGGDVELPADAAAATDAQLERAPLFDAHHQALMAVGTEQHRQLVKLTEDRDRARERQQDLRDAAGLLREQAKSVGRLAEQVDADDYRLKKYKKALDQHAKAETSARQAGLSQRRAAQAAADTARRESGSARNGLRPKQKEALSEMAAAERLTEAQLVDQIYHGYREAKRLNEQAAGLEARANFMDRRLGGQPGEIANLDAQIAAKQATIDVLKDPNRAIEQRLTRMLKANAVYGRQPANLTEANNWSIQWKLGLTLEHSDGRLRARIPEFPGWKHPLTDDQLIEIDKAIQHGNELAIELRNLDMPPEQAIRAQQHGIDSYGIDR